MKKYIFPLLMLTLLLGGCMKKNEVGQYRVAAILPQNATIHATDYWVKVWEGIHAGAKDSSLLLSEYEIDDQYTAQDYLEMALEADLDGLIINASPGIREDLVQIRQQGCKVLALDSDPGEEVYDIFVGIDNAASARALCEHMLSLYEGGKILLLKVDASGAVKERIEAFTEAVMQAGLSEALLPLEMREENEERIEDMQRMLEQGEDITQIVSFDPSCTLQAAECISRLKLSEQVFLAGFGEFASAGSYMEDGTIDALLEQDNVALGKTAAEAVGRLLEGKEPVEKRYYVDTHLSMGG